MTSITTRSGKGSPLTHDEVDANFTNLNADKLEISGGTVTGNLGVTGNLTVDTNTLLVNAATNRVGIGVSSPAVLLDVLGDGLIQRLRSTTSTAAYLRFDGTGTSFPYVGLLNGIGTFGNTDASPIRFMTNSSERMRITSTGSVGIGTSSPAATLDVAGTGAVKVPVGTDAQRPSAVTGLFRFNTTSGAFEGYDGSAWGSIGGGGAGAKAWVNLNGTGTVAIRESFNVSSITDNGAGNYTVNFATAMDDANYVVAGSAGATIAQLIMSPTSIATQLAGSAGIIISNTATLADNPLVNVVITR